MKKRFTAICAALALSASTVPAIAAEIPEKVEITFKVGDSVLTVNGNPLEVTAPYVVGDGTTLVPVRVITEAFGAEVNWDGETQSVNLKYPDVDITIQIGSKSAQVNTHTEELLAAPELYQDTTMVPLRFISETFGAKVDYNDGLITVTKEAAKETTSTIEGMTDKEFIGDSFHSWTMKNPKTLQMTERSFDGTYTEFESESGKSGILIDIVTQDENYNIDEEFNAVKNLFSNGSISIADKKQMNDGSTQIHFRSKTKDIESDVFEYIEGNKLYTVYSDVHNDDEAIKNELFSIGESFSLIEKRDFHDLSNVKDGARAFSDDDYSFSLSLPSDWYQLTDIQPNLFVFCNPKNTKNEFAVGICSKSDTVSASSLIEGDRQRQLETTNKDLVKVSEIGTTTLCGTDAYFYTAEYNGDGFNKYYMKDLFIELDDYVYNITVRGAHVSAVDKLLSGFNVSAPDSEKLGIILRTSDITGTTKIALLNGNVTASNYWQKIAGNAIRDARTEAQILVNVINDPNNEHSPLDAITRISDALIEDGRNIDTVGNVKNLKKGDVLFNSQELKQSGDEYSVYSTLYAAKIQNKVYIFQYVRDDVYYGGSIDKEAEEIIAGFTAE